MPLFLLLYLLLEISLFIGIGGEIGIGLTFLWIMGTGFLGSFVLSHRLTGWMQTNPAPKTDDFPIEPVFDAFILPVAAFLLILPGFAGDALGFLLLIGPLRRVFYRLVRNHGRENFNGFYSWTSEQKTKIVDGDYRRIDDRRE